MNLDKIETQEEKEAFEGMASNSEILISSGWKNGDECEYKNEDDEWSTGGRYVCYDDYASHHVFYATNMTLYYANGDQLRKPETPEQKAERERLEAAFEVYLAFWSASKNTIITMSMSEFKDCHDLKHWLAIVDKTGYRKQNG